jgi:hypothetical protein
MNTYLNPMSSTTNVIHTFSDGSTLIKMSVRQLMQIPIWRSNRVLDYEHVEEIKKSLNGNIRKLDSKLFHVARYPMDDSEYDNRITQYVEKIVDGQHRITVLLQWFASHPNEPDFNVLVSQKTYFEEKEVIEDFKILNKSKPVLWNEDPIVCAQPYILALIDAFNTSKKLIRSQERTHKPFITFDKLQDMLVKKRIGQGMRMTPKEFAQKALEINATYVENAIAYGNYQEDKLLQRAISYDFMLGLEDEWIDHILSD